MLTDSRMLVKVLPAPRNRRPAAVAPVASSAGTEPDDGGLASPLPDGGSAGPAGLEWSSRGARRGNPGRLCSRPGARATWREERTMLHDPGRFPAERESAGGRLKAFQSRLDPGQERRVYGGRSWPPHPAGRLRPRDAPGCQRREGPAGRCGCAVITEPGGGQAAVAGTGRGGRGCHGLLVFLVRWLVWPVSVRGKSQGMNCPGARASGLSRAQTTFPAEGPPGGPAGW
jgi:hypothetical protein